MWFTGRVGRFVVLVALIVVFGGGVAVFGVPDSEAVAARVSGLGPAAPVLAVAVCAVLVLGLFPRTLLSAVAGLVFGPLAGSGYVIVGATVGALAAFGLGRWLGRDFVAAQSRIRRIDGWLTDGGVLSVVTVRLLPIAPFGLVSYGFGTSGVRLRWFGLGTVLGMLPSTVIYANLGAAAADPTSSVFLLMAAVAAVFGACTVCLATWVARRRARSQIAGATSGS